jgi:hypothetical protein
MIICHIRVVEGIFPLFPLTFSLSKPKMLLGGLDTSTFISTTSISKEQIMDGLAITKTLSKEHAESMGYLVHQPPWKNGEWMQHHH